MFGFTPFDPVVVVLGTLFAAYLLVRTPAKLIGWLPAAFTLYFFIPLITLLTLWQTIPLLLAARVLIRARLEAAPTAKPIVILLLIAFVASCVYALTLGSDPTRTAIRSLYYIGLFAIASFAYEMSRRHQSYRKLLKGLAILGIVLALYGLYQMIAVRTGLPFRGIVRGTAGAQMAFEGGFVRINSFASEPKRLAYVLIVCGLATVFLSNSLRRRKQLVRLTGFGIMGLSLFTFSGSFYLTIAIFAVAVGILYLKNFVYYAFAGAAAVALSFALVPDLEIYSVVQDGIERRMDEVDYDLDGERIYRQEFFAWEYLSDHPDVAFGGVGVGQYYSVLNGEFGEGVGINEFGGLLPLNSTVLEMVFDLGGVVTFAFYTSLFILILQLRRRREHFLCMALLFLVIQSFTILTIHMMVLIAAVATARLQYRQTSNSPAPYRSIRATRARARSYAR